MIVEVFIITDLSAIAQAKYLTGLLTELNALYGFHRTIAFSELIRVRIRLNSTAELFDRTEGNVLNVIRVKRSSLCSRRRLSNCCKTIPCYSGARSTRLIFIKHSMVHAGFIKSFTGLIPYNFSHKVVLLLKINCKNPVIQIVFFI